MKEPKRLLIVDDNAEILASLSNFFTKRGFSVMAASNGLDGLKLFEAEAGRFDLVVTDIVMPNISGVGLIAIIKKRRPGLPVVAITGFGEHPEALAAEAEADLVIVKPIKLDQLENHILSLLERSASNRQTSHE